MADYRGQVVFESIPKTYPTDAHIECSYTLKPTHQYSAYDWVGLFKVGWSNVNDHLYYIWVPSPKNRVEGEDCNGFVLFQASTLPKEDGEFYQFIYINEKGKMCGASSPFHFRTPRNEDYIAEEMQEDEDMLFITTRQVKLEEQLDTLEKEQERLVKTCDSLTQENSELQKRLEESQIELAEVEEEKGHILLQLQDASRVKEELTQKSSDESNAASRKYEELQQRTEELEKKNHAAELQISERDQTLVKLRNELDHYSGQVDALKKEKELYHADRAAAESAKQEAQIELASLQRRYNESASEKEVLDTLQAQLTSSQETIDALENNKKQQKELIDNQHEKLLATEARHVVDTEEIHTLTETLATLSSKIEDVQTDNFELKKKLAESKERFDVAKRDWDTTFEKTAKEKNGLISTIGELNLRIEKLNEERVSACAFDEQEDRYIALQAAYHLLKEELKSNESELNNLKHKEAKLREANKQFHRLQGRLDKGEEAKKRIEESQTAAARSPPSRSGSVIEDYVAPVVRRFTTGAASALADIDREDLTKGELQKMVEQLSTELELRTQKKDKYKSKYLDEKQRAAAMKDFYKGEMEKQSRDLELARAQLDQQVLNSPGVRSPPALTPAEIKPIVYPPVGGIERNTDLQASGSAPRDPAKSSAKLRKRLSDTSKSKGALEQSLIEDVIKTKEPLKPLQAPLEPLRVDTTGPPACNRSSVSEPPTPVTPIVYPSTLDTGRSTERRSHREELVVSRQEDSDEDNEGPDRFHDASELPLKCCFCDKIFVATDTEEMRNAHVNEHMSASGGSGVGERFPSTDYYLCPLCPQKFSKTQITEDQLNEHVNSHFTITD